MVQRLVLVSTAHLRWPRSARSVAEHGCLLHRLLDPAEGNGWFTCLDPSERRDVDAWRPADPRFAGEPDPWHWHAEGGEALETFLADLDTACYEDATAVEPTAEDPLRPFRHRIFLDAARFRAVTGWTPSEGGSPEFSVLLDMRVSRLKNISICHINLSIWSGPPWSSHHRPDDVREHRLDLGSPDLIEAKLHETFLDVRSAVAALLTPYFTVANLRVFGRPYRAPIFWGAISAGRPEDPLELIDEHGHLRLAGAASELLGLADDRDEAVGRAVLDGDVLVLRTFGPDVDAAQDVPTYLLVPARARSRARRHDHRSHPSGHRSTSLTRHEDAMRRTITILTDLESEAAAYLWDAETDLDIWDNHLHVYGNAADRAGRLWDGLASHLPIERRNSLARLHKSIQLLHQTLIQGVADVDRILTWVEERQSYIAGQVTELDARFHQSFTETRVSNRRTISEALTSTGHFAEVRRRSNAMANGARRVAQNYRNLLTAISDSFNERRVRENDVLQRSGAALAAGVATFGLISALGATLNGRQDLVGSARWWLWGPVIAVSTFLVLVLGRWAVSYVRIGKLGGVRYRLVYRRLWRFLRGCSSARLDNLRNRIEDPVDLRLELRHHAAETLAALSEARNAREERRNHVWRHYDGALAREFAEVWDLIDLLPGDERVVEELATPDTPAAPSALSRRRLRSQMDRDRRQLARMVEKWSLRTLLFTERPREMWHYNLVQVTLMYHAAFPLMGRRHHVVSWTDLHFVLGRFPRQAFRTSQIDLIGRWVDDRAVVLWEEFERGQTPDFRTGTTERRWWTRRIRQARQVVVLCWALRRTPKEGRGARMLADIENAGFAVGVGGFFHEGVRRKDHRECVLAKIGRTNNGRDPVVAP